MTLFFLLLNLTVDYFYFENLFSNCIMKNKLYSKVRADVLKQLYSRFLLISVVAFLGVFSVNAQNLNVKGKVFDKNTREPLIGVTVLEKGAGTSNGTITALDGDFSISVKPDAVLVISYIGYVTQEIPVNGKTNIEVLLSEDSKVLDEVVVVGYGSQSKRKVTTAISNVTSEDLLRSSSTTTAGALSGKMAGVSTRALDARPGRGINVEIRNMGKPLYVIDGIPYGGDASRSWVGTSHVSGEDAFNALSLEDIESISVLKDASASIYGLRAANGVVLVTTKKGTKDDKVKVNLNGYYGWQNLTRFPELASAPQYVRGLLESEQNAGKDPSSLYSKEEYAKWQAGTEPGYKSYDYYDIIMRKNVPQSNINANITGGSARSNYYISLTNTKHNRLCPLSEKRKRLLQKSKNRFRQKLKLYI